jgi:hypothetical protein
VYVEPFPAMGERSRVSTKGGGQALWREDGRELFFVSDDRKTKLRWRTVLHVAGPSVDGDAD